MSKIMKTNDEYVNFMNISEHKYNERWNKCIGWILQVKLVNIGCSGWKNDENLLSVPLRLLGSHEHLADQKRIYNPILKNYWNWDIFAFIA